MDKQTTCQLIQKISKLGGSSESVQILLVECLWSSLQDLPKNSLVPTRCPLLQWDCLPHPDEKEQLPRKPSKNIKHSHQRHRLHRLFSSPLADARLKHPPICVGRAVRRRPGTGLKSCHHYAPGKMFFSNFASRLHKWKLQFLEWLFFSYRWQIFSAFPHQAKENERYSQIRFCQDTQTELQ